MTAADFDFSRCEGETMHRIQVIDSHTAGEPTRVVMSGGPELGQGTIAQRLERFRQTHDAFRSAIVNEPRGSDVLVGALLCEPVDPSNAAGVIFFNNVGYLGMCGHGTIGLIATLAHVGKISPGVHRIETSVGTVAATLHDDGSVSVENVVSFRQHRQAEVDVPGLGRIRGDVAWAGNWFFLVQEHGQTLSLNQVERLTDVAWKIRLAANSQGFPEIDHVELFGPAVAAPAGQVMAQSRNFVLCPGKAYDRSPCGTGTSAKLACLAADGKLAAGETWIQESIIGTQFAGSYHWHDQAAGQIIPTIRGQAFINAEAQLILDHGDPFCWGIR